MKPQLPQVHRQSVHKTATNSSLSDHRTAAGAGIGMACCLTVTSYRLYNQINSNYFFAFLVIEVNLKAQIRSIL